jgi:hypothetical protein
MSLPDGLPTTALSFGPYPDVAGVAALFEYTVKIVPVHPQTRRPISVLHPETGDVLISTAIETTLDEDSTGLSVPIARSGTGQTSPDNFLYSATWYRPDGTQLVRGEPGPENKVFALPADSPSVQDYDLLGYTEASPAIQVPIGVGPQGDPGPSAYEVALEEGFVGTPEEWLETLVGPEGDPGPQGAPAPIGITDYVTAGTHTYNIPAGTQELEIIAVGGGGGGGGGSREPLGNRSGGAGGGGAGMNLRVIPVVDLGGRTQLTIIVGAGGAGGTGATTDSTNGSTGGNGTSCVIRTSDLALELLRAANGTGGGGGTTVSSTAGAAGPGLYAGGAGGSSGTTGQASTGASATGAAGGGGGGGGNASTPHQANSGGGNLSDNRPGATTIVFDPATGVNTKGADGLPGIAPWQPGLGGRGGQAATTTTGGTGGAGGWPGGAGGGGGSALNGFNGGQGGAGASGAVRIIAR